jgi:hypothetical protein
VSVASWVMAGAEGTRLAVEALGPRPKRMVDADGGCAQVMTLEWVEGARLVDKDYLQNYGADPTKLVDTLVQCSLKQMLEVRRADLGFGGRGVQGTEADERHSLRTFEQPQTYGALCEEKC